MTLPPEKGRKVYFIQHHEVHSHLPLHLSAGSYHLPMKKVTISGWLVDTMADLYGDQDVVLVPNSVDLELFQAPERGRQAAPTVGFCLMMQTCRTFNSDLELGLFERRLLRLEGLDDLGRQVRKLAEIEWF